jgi:hypothetical protein
MVIPSKITDFDFGSTHSDEKGSKIIGWNGPVCSHSSMIVLWQVLAGG